MIYFSCIIWKLVYVIIFLVLYKSFRGGPMTLIEQIKEDIGEFNDRYKSILSVPVINGCIEEGIHFILKTVHQQNLSDIELTKLLMNKFSISNNTAKNVRPTLERANLLMKEDLNLIKITNMSHSYLKTKKISYLSKGFVYSYFGFLEILFLVAENKPRNLREINKEWVNYYEELYGNRSLATHKQHIMRVSRYLNEFKLLIKNDNNITVNTDEYLKLREVEYF
jgi:hypothetical protein